MGISKPEIITSQNDRSRSGPTTTISPGGGGAGTGPRRSAYMPGTSSRCSPASVSAPSSSGEVVEGVAHHRNGRPRSRYGVSTARARSGARPGAKRALVMPLNSGNATGEW